ALSSCPYDDLRAEWRRLYRNHPPKKIRRDLLELGIAWKLQEKALGGLAPVLKRRLAGLAVSMATKGDLAKARVVSLRPGARLVREWHGDVHEIVVLEDGFQWRGERWRSLTAIARTITGVAWSGPRFFGIGAVGKVDEDARTPAITTPDQDDAADAVSDAIGTSTTAPPQGEAAAVPMEVDRG
ncbi:MAG: DUF2924 domain-containing protein, partial [Bauldia sp.]